jgi:hypothetical protein
MPSEKGAISPRLSMAAAKDVGKADGVFAAEAIALVLVSRYTPALYGALTLAAAGMSKIPSTGFVETMAKDAHGSAWPWRGRAAYADETRGARSAYINAFEESFAVALRSKATPGGATRDLVAALYRRSGSRARRRARSLA